MICSIPQHVFCVNPLKSPICGQFREMPPFLKGVIAALPMDASSPIMNLSPKETDGTMSL